MPAPLSAALGRPVVLSWLFVSVLTSLPYARAAAQPPPGRVFVGFFYYVDDAYNYLAFVQQAEDGAFLLRNKDLSPPRPARLVNLEWWLVGRLSALLGRHPAPAYRLFGLAAALGVGPGQEVVCPSFTFVSTANAILRVGASPVLADIEETTLGLDPADTEARLSPRTAAILPVHYAGFAAPMDGLLDLARRRGLKVVEDAAQGLGASFRGTPLGALGDAGCISFHETKNVTCGEGGALALRDREVAERAEIIREKGTNRAAFLRGEVDKYTWVAEGSSYVLSDLLAAILDAQLDKQERIAARRRAVATRYREGLLRLPMHPLLDEADVEPVIDAVTARHA